MAAKPPPGTQQITPDTPCLFVFTKRSPTDPSLTVRASGVMDDLLCARCQVMLSVLWDPQYGEPREIEIKDMKLHHATWSGLYEAAGSGCVICQCLFRIIENETRTEGYDVKLVSWIQDLPGLRK